MSYFFLVYFWLVGERDSNALTRGGADRRGGERGGGWDDAEESSVVGELATGPLVTLFCRVKTSVNCELVPPKIAKGDVEESSVVGELATGPLVTRR